VRRTREVGRALLDIDDSVGEGSVHPTSLVVRGIGVQDRCQERMSEADATSVERDDAAPDRGRER
jgi:hypothetical protein